VIDSLCQEKEISDRFAIFFQNVRVPNTSLLHKELESKFVTLYSNYIAI